MKTYQLFCLLTLGLLASCTPSYTYFTKDLYEQEKWSADDIMHIQFYVSKDIVLTRAVNAGETSISDGKIKIINGQRVEQVIIRSGTPGVLVLMPREDRFAISFEEADNEAYLMFGPNPKYSNRFALLAQEWRKETGEIHYGGKVYTAESQSAFACLMVDLKKVGQSQYDKRSVPGRTIKN